MKTKTELNAYLATLKGVAKKGDMKYALIKNGKITTTDGNLVASLALPTKGDGKYELSALDALKVNTDIDLSVYRIGDYDTLIDTEVSHIRIEDTHLLSDQEKKALVFASTFASTDTTRKALMQTVINNNGWLVATDGYRAFAERVVNIVPEKDLYLSPEIMTAFGKTQKYGNWSLGIGTESMFDNLFASLTNGTLSLIEMQKEFSYPDILRLMNITEPMDTVMDISVRDLAKIVDNTHRHVIVREDGHIDLTNYTGDKKQTPLTVSCLTHATPFIPDKDWTRRIIIMPLKVSEGEMIGVDYAFIKGMPIVDTDNGDIRLVFAKGKLSPMLVAEG